MVAAYETAMAPYRSGKGTLRFRLDAPLPIGLVTKLAKVRVATPEQEARADDPLEREFAALEEAEAKKMKAKP